MNNCKKLSPLSSDTGKRMQFTSSCRPKLPFSHSNTMQLISVKTMSPTKIETISCSSHSVLLQRPSPVLESFRISSPKLISSLLRVRSSCCLIAVSTSSYSSYSETNLNCREKIATPAPQNAKRTPYGSCITSLAWSEASHHPFTTF